MEETTNTNPRVGQNTQPSAPEVAEVVSTDALVPAPTEEEKTVDTDTGVVAVEEVQS